MKRGGQKEVKKDEGEEKEWGRNTAGGEQATERALQQQYMCKEGVRVYRQGCSSSSKVTRSR